MINPNIHKRITVTVNETITSISEYRLSNATYKNTPLRVMLRKKRKIETGKRRLFLKYSITGDQFYLSDC